MSTQSPNWDDFRRQMPVTRRWAYFDHAAVAPLPEYTRQTMTHWLSQATEEGDTRWPEWSKKVEETRAYAISLLKATTPEEIALVPNTTAGISLVAEGFPWREGDNVVIPDNEFPSNQYPWMNLASRGVECRRVPVTGVRLDLDELFAACDGRTRLISVSWVGYATGWRTNLTELVERAHQRRILIFLDAIQGLGVFPLDIHDSGVDFLAADGHKWLLGPEGAGIFYVRSEHLEKLRPQGLGWHSVAHAHDFRHIELKLKPSAARFEGGSQNMAGFIGLCASLDTLGMYGVADDPCPIAQRVLEITDLACEKLAAAGAKIISSRTGDERSGIVSFEWPGHEQLAVKRRCLEAGVVLTVRNGWLRISPHAYCNEDDIDRLISSLPPPA